MILQHIPIRTPCCERLAMRTVMTVFHLGDVISAKVSASPAQQALCSHCGGTIARDKGGNGLTASMAGCNATSSPGCRRYRPPVKTSSTCSWLRSLKSWGLLKTPGRFRCLLAQDELDVLYDAKNAGDRNGTFNETGLFPAGWYRSSSGYDNSSVWRLRFSDGNQYNVTKNGPRPVRCCRR